VETRSISEKEKCVGPLRFLVQRGPPSNKPQKEKKRSVLGRGEKKEKRLSVGEKKEPKDGNPHLIKPPP